jgi:hypothetical protein
MPVFGRHKMKDPIEGQAKVVNVNSIPVTSDLRQRCDLDLIVEAPGLDRAVVSVTVHVNSNKWPSRDQLLPVLVDRADPAHLEVIWDRVTSFDERRQAQRAERLAQANAPRAAAAVPAGVSSAAQVLAAGQPAQVLVQHAQRLGIQNPQGHDMYALTLLVMIDGLDAYTVVVGNPVPPGGVALVEEPAALPAKVLPDNPRAVVIDWAAALAR